MLTETTTEQEEMNSLVRISSEFKNPYNVQYMPRDCKQDKYAIVILKRAPTFSGVRSLCA